MKPPKAVKHIPSTMETRDAQTGELIKREGMSWNILPPAADKCQICAVAHEPEEPHDKGSLYYKMTFYSMHGRDATWADAMAHCSIEMKTLWEARLRELNAWSEPPAGEDPIAHHGVE